MHSVSWNVTNWEFTPDASSETGASLPIVRERSTRREWAGIAAIGGVVRVYVPNGVEQRTFQARITVTDRPSPWRFKWSYERDTISSESDEPKPPVQERGLSHKQARSEAARSTIGTMTRVVGFEEEVMEGPPSRRP
jgi:hypothetical protein